MVTSSITRKGVVFSFILLGLCCFLTKELRAEPSPFFQSLEPYKPIYLLNSWFLDGEGDEQGYDDRELMIQFSFKKQFFRNLYFGFSYRAFWQIYDLPNSRPFREQNYNPEAFLEFDDLWGSDIFRLGLTEHESNGGRIHYDEDGEEVNYSRTWDRSYVYAWKHLSDYIGLGMKLWVVTSPKTEEFSAFYDDNPDMQHYMGSGELYASLGQYPTVLTLMLRRGWADETETCRIEARLPLYHLFNGEDSGHDLYLLYFSGYGDSLIDYNRKVTRIALGVSFR